MALLNDQGGMEFPYAKDDVFDAVLAAASSLSMKVREADEMSGEMLLKAGLRRMSWGENFAISVSPAGPGNTRVKASSANTGMAVMWGFDLGKKRRGVEDIMTETSRVLADREKNGKISRLKA
jgi:hypothetical protein